MKSQVRGPTAAKYLTQQWNQYIIQYSDTVDTIPNIYVLDSGFESYVRHVMITENIVDKSKYVSNYQKIYWGY